ncbi:MAG: hypothetical protein LBM25_03435 [Bacteroidales bacterium]|nr:hypothetical protein [Bacteroidales bacterium]
MCKYYDLSIKFPNDKSYKEKFFDNFPNDFKTFNSIYGYNEYFYRGRNIIYSGPLSGAYNYEHIHDLFCNLVDVVNKDKFYMKIVNLTIDNYWEADSELQFCIQEKIINDIDYVLKAVNTLSEKDAYGFWFFIFDRPHPSNLKELYDALYKIAIIKDSKQALLMEKAYKWLIEEDDHGH